MATRVQDKYKNGDKSTKTATRIQDKCIKIATKVHARINLVMYSHRCSTIYCASLLFFFVLLSHKICTFVSQNPAAVTF